MHIEYENFDGRIRAVGNRLIESYSKTRVVPGGVNGPYNDQETTIRNLCHLIVIMSIEILKFQNDPLRPLLKELGERLIQSRGSDGLYTLRIKDHKDACNGVIGHAWVIEAYVYLSRVFGERVYLEIATDLFKSHAFDEELGLWHRPGLRNAESIDYTLNHQLWFAASAAELFNRTQNQEIGHVLSVFWKNLDSNLTVHANGLICHWILNRTSNKNKYKYHLKRWIDTLKRLGHLASYAYKENGYHIFNFMAFARLYSSFSKSGLIDGRFWRTNKMLRAINYMNGEALRKELENRDWEKDLSLQNDIQNLSEKEINIYGYPYNVPGFEISYVRAVNPEFASEDTELFMLSRQFELTYDKENVAFGPRCFDRETINYRVYEYFRAIEERVAIFSK